MPFIAGQAYTSCRRIKGRKANAADKKFNMRTIHWHHLTACDLVLSFGQQAQHSFQLETQNPELVKINGFNYIFFVSF